MPPDVPLGLCPKCLVKAAIDTLTRWKNPSTAAALANHMAAGFDILETGGALGELGPAAEEAVDGLLTQKNREVRRQACRILEKIGTKTSIPFLTTASSSDELTALVATRALKAIEARQ